MLYDCTNMVAVSTRIQIGIGPMQNAITVSMLVSRDANIQLVCQHLTALVTLPDDVEIRDDHSSIIYSLLDNRRSLDCK